MAKTSKRFSIATGALFFFFFSHLHRLLEHKHKPLFATLVNTLSFTCESSPVRSKQHRLLLSLSVTVLGNSNLLYRIMQPVQRSTLLLIIS